MMTKFYGGLAMVPLILALVSPDARADDSFEARRSQYIQKRHDEDAFCASMKKKQETIKALQLSAVGEATETLITLENEFYAEYSTYDERCLSVPSEYYFENDGGIGEYDTGYARVGAKVAAGIQRGDSYLLGVKLDADILKNRKRLTGPRSGDALEHKSYRSLDGSLELVGEKDMKTERYSLRRAGLEVTLPMVTKKTYENSLRYSQNKKAKNSVHLVSVAAQAAANEQVQARMLVGSLDLLSIDLESLDILKSGSLRACIDAKLIRLKAGVLSVQDKNFNFAFGSEVAMCLKLLNTLKVFYGHKIMFGPSDAKTSDTVGTREINYGLDITAGKAGNFGVSVSKESSWNDSSSNAEQNKTIWINYARDIH